MKKISLSIADPCHQQWSSFTPTRQGGFCSACQKEVIDFTSWSEERIIAHLQRSKNTCGQFKPGQLKTYVLDDAARSRPQVFFGAFFMTVLSLFMNRPSEAQTKGSVRILTEQRFNAHGKQNESTQIASPPVPLTVSGIVTSDDDGSALPGVNIVRKGTREGTVSDVQGRFELTLTNPGNNETLVFSFIGMETEEVPAASFKANPFNMEMREDTTASGIKIRSTVMALHMNTAVLGGLSVTRVTVVNRLNPVRLWHGIKRLFKKKNESQEKPAPSEIVPVNTIVEETVVPLYEKVSVVCYPNPAIDNINVELPSSAQEKYISLCTAQGQLIEERVTLKSNEQFNVHDLPSGIYLLTTKVDGVMKCIRVVKK